MAALQTDGETRSAWAAALGMVSSLSQPGGNATGINFFLSQIDAKNCACRACFFQS